MMPWKIRTILRTSKMARHCRDLFQNNNVFFNNGYRKISRLLKSKNDCLVIDVGGNVGQFGLDLRRYGYRGNILSIEPTSPYFEILSDNVKKYGPWETLKASIGYEEGKVKINVSGNDGLSSSILETSSVHISEFPTSASVDVQETEVMKLKSLLIQRGINPRSVFLKIDVQGYELEVLKGCEELLEEFLGVFCEISLSELYENEPRYWEVLSFLDKNNQQVIDLFPGVRSKEDVLLQVDVLTLRRGKKEGTGFKGNV